MFQLDLLVKLAKRWIGILLGFFPSKLPIGGTEFDRYASSILETYNLPNKDDFKHAIATMIMHLGPLTTRVSKRYFAKSIQKAMVNEVAYYKIQEFKKKVSNGGGEIESAPTEVVPKTEEVRLQ